VCHRWRSYILASQCLPEQHGAERAPPLFEAVRGAVLHHWPSRRHSRCTSLAEKPQLPAPFWAFLIEHSLPYVVCLLLEPAVNEGTH
jgi:hypothetical protein